MDAEVLPVGAQATQRKPPCRAKDAAAVMPVSLKDPVGFMPWCFAKSCPTPAARPQEGSSYSGVFPSRRVMTWLQSCNAGRISRKRQTPLSSRAFQEVRRCSQSCLSPAASNPAARIPELVFQPGKATSSRSPQCAQRTLLAPSSPTAPHAMQRNCDTPVSTLDANAAWSVIQLLAYGMDELLVSAQVLISLANPVGARRIEYIEVNRVHHGFRLVRHVGRDGQDLAGIHHDLFA